LDQVGRPAGDCARLQGEKKPLIARAIVQEVKSRRQTYPWSLGEIVGTIHDVRTKSLGEFIDGHLQAALPSRRAEKIELNPIIDANQVVGDHADQAEGTGLVELVEKIDGN
jgi:hypothetical protein